MHTPRNPNFLSAAEAVFIEAAFIQDLGIVFRDAGMGWCESYMALLDRHKQHHGLVHAGVQATLADHTAGAAATTLICPDEGVLSVEFKINLLRLAQGEALEGRAEVLKAGRNLVVVEAEVYGVSGNVRALVAKATVTLAVQRARPFSETQKGEPYEKGALPEKG